jgi:hypothetical protein
VTNAGYLWSYNIEGGGDGEDKKEDVRMEN